MTDRRAFYDSRAPVREREKPRYYQELLRRHFAFLVPAGVRVLEVGSGLGDLLASFKTAEARGLDFSSAMVSAATRRHPDVQFQVADQL